jgi:hypothetical protein
MFALTISGMAQRTSRRPRPLERLAVAACLTAGSLAASVSPAAASVTIGQLAPGNPTATCGHILPADWAQPTVTSGNPYVVPGAGTITSWSHNAATTGGQTLTMKVFRKVTDPTFYQVVGHDGPRPLAGGLLNTFPASIPAKPGDILGLNTGPPADTACAFSVPGESYLLRGPGNLADGQSAAFGSEADFRLNVSAEFLPSNSFTLGKAKRNKKKGTATLTVHVPNPGELALSGKGVKAVAAKSAPAAGKVELLIRAKGKKKRKLNETGKVKVNPKVTYTPTGGDPSTQSRRLKLKKR